MKPEVTEDDMHGYKYEHPAYGTINISRGSGQVDLFDSDVSHQHFINLTINRAVRYDDGRHQFIHSKEQLIEVRMSETQFARAITSMNMGSGAPCTLEWFNGERLPDVVLEDRRVAARAAFRETIKSEDEGLEEMIEKLKELRSNKKRPTLAEVDDLIQRLVWSRERLENNMEFNLECFEEHMEKVVDEAKAELEVHALNTNNLISLKRPDAVSIDGPSGGEILDAKNISSTKERLPNNSTR